VSRLSGFTWQQVVRALERAGREIKTGTLREILRESNLSRDEFLQLLK